jgi:AraC-like DNA-binding protein
MRTVDFLVKLLSYVNAAGAVHALIQAAVLFLSRKGNRRAHRFLALFLLALAPGMASGMLSLLGAYDRWPALSVLVAPAVLAYGPLFFLYIREMTALDKRRRASDALHAVPLLLGALAYAAYLGPAGRGAGSTGLLGFAARSPWIVVLGLSTIQTIFYVAAVIRLLRDHSARVKATYSMIERVNLGWLRWRLAVYAAIWTVGLALMAAVGFGNRAGVVGQVVAFLIALNTFAAVYRAMLQPEIFFGPAEAGPGRRYDRSSLTAGNAELYKARLLEGMGRERFYLDPEISLPKLAQSLDIPVAHLSRVINDLLGRNFYEFINRYRVEAAQARLSSPDAGRDKLIAVALECGFNSLATFNRVFKELTGRTPSDYRKNASTI